MIIAQISDTHLLSLHTGDQIAVRRADDLTRSVAAINALKPQVDAVIHTGDMVNFGEDNDYGLAREILGELDAPFFPVVGNRDDRRGLIDAFVSPGILPKNAPFCQYRVSLPGGDLIAVDTKSDTRRVGTSCAKRLAELEGLLNEDRNKPVILFLHHPPVPVEALKNPLQFESVAHARALTDLLDEYDNIIRILCGHTHRSDILPIGRHTASTHPSLATDLRLDRYPPRFAQQPILQVHRLEENGLFTSRSQFAAGASSAAA